MHPESEKRAAQLAVSRYGAAAAKVQQVYQVILQKRQSGQMADLLDALVGNKLLTSAQGQELRAGLETTHVDDSPRPRSNGQPSKNGASKPVVKPTAELTNGDLRQLGDYRILRRLGDGGMGSVYLGYQEGDQRHVAIKVLSDQQAVNQAAIDRFYREAKSCALLNHPNIVHILSIGQDQATERHYLVMEFVDGFSALELLQRKGRLSVSDAVHLALDVARALEHAHSRNIIHRDIKPGNILITQSGLAKITDFGLAKRTDEASHLTAARQGFGTPYYMPYEQAMNAKYADGRSDIYALGATLYHLVAGEVPFQGSSHLAIVEKKSIGEFPPARSHNPAVPAVLENILAKMLAREPADRYQTASELIVDLERSGLAAKVPSFIDADRAMQDPVVRERLTAQAQATSPDLSLPKHDSVFDTPKAHPDIWYLRYRDQSGRWCKAKATTEQVLKRLRERRYPSDIEASHLHDAEFLPLDSFPVFAKAATPATNGRITRGPARKPPPENDAPVSAVTPSRVWLSSAGVAIVVVIVALVVARLLLWS